MEHYGIFLVALGVTYVISGIVAIISYFVLGPLLMAEQEKFPVKEQYLNFGNFIYMYKNIKAMREKGNQQAGIVLSLIRYSSLICATSFLSFIIAGIVGSLKY